MNNVPSLANALSLSDRSEVKKSFPPHQSGLGVRWIYYTCSTEDFENRPNCRVTIHDIGKDYTTHMLDGIKTMRRVRKRLKVEKQLPLVLSSPPSFHISQSVGTVECHLMRWYENDLGILWRWTNVRQTVFQCLRCDTPILTMYSQYGECESYFSNFAGLGRCATCFKGY